MSLAAHGQNPSPLEQDQISVACQYHLRKVLSQGPSSNPNQLLHRRMRLTPGRDQSLDTEHHWYGSTQG